MRTECIFTKTVFGWFFSYSPESMQPTRTFNQIDNITVLCDVAIHSLNRSVQLIVTKSAVCQTAILVFIFIASHEMTLILHAISYL
jgi:hypothetical protein